MQLINQPFGGQLGEILIEKLNANFNKLTILSAFAKNSGVLRLKPSLEKFKENGGTIQIFVGVDLLGTSYEALLNLLHLVDALYVVHSEDNATTFHSKVYLLENDAEIWIAVGSNNLTGGGLWTNFESFQCGDCCVGTPKFDKLYTPLANLINGYKNPSYECSRLIESEQDIAELEQMGYVTRETTRQRIEQYKEQASRTQKRTEPLFGRQRRASLPRIKTPTLGTASAGIDPVQVSARKTVLASHVIETTNESERIWFETRKLTGGSRNILDLSKVGRVIKGNAEASRYATNDQDFILGGIAFFDIPPESTSVVKDITINYLGVDYEGCTIKFATNNGSWRIQLKGENSSGVKLHSIDGIGWLVNKILVFEKIRTDYYSLSVLESDDLQACRDASYVFANNGSSRNSKEYGLL